MKWQAWTPSRLTKRRRFCDRSYWKHIKWHVDSFFHGMRTGKKGDVSKRMLACAGFFPAANNSLPRYKPGNFFILYLVKHKNFKENFFFFRLRYVHPLWVYPPLFKVKLKKSYYFLNFKIKKKIKLINYFFLM